MTITLDTPVTDFPGVGPARAKKLEKLGILRAADLLTYYPRDYEDRRRIWSIRAAPLGRRSASPPLRRSALSLSYIRKGMELVKLRVVDNSGTLYLTFFNQSYLKNSFQPGEEYVFYGEIQEQGSRRSMVNPVFEREGDRDFTGRIVPVYPLTAGISNHLMVSPDSPGSRAVRRPGAESLPASLRAAHRLVPAERACRDIHFPEDFDALEQARRRLTFEELFYLSAGLTLLEGPPGQPVLRRGVCPPPLGGVLCPAPLRTHPGPAAGHGGDRLGPGLWPPHEPAGPGGRGLR